MGMPLSSDAVGNQIEFPRRNQDRCGVHPSQFLPSIASDGPTPVYPLEIIPAGISNGVYLASSTILMKAAILSSPAIAFIRS